MFLITCSAIAFDQIARFSAMFPKRKRDLVRALKEVRDLLSRDPLGCSESRQNRDRVCIVRPLTVYFSVDFQNDAVEIIQFFFNPKP